MADEFRAPLMHAAATAALDHQLAVPGAVPVRLGQAFLGGGRQAGGQGSRRRAHRVASVPRIRVLTGVTIGPPMTRAVCAPGTWLQAVPRSWRTASITSSSPCM